MNEIKSKDSKDSVLNRIRDIIKTRPDNDNAVKQMLLNAFNSIGEGNQQPHVMEEHFYWLVELGLIKVTASRYNRLMVEALKNSERKTNYDTVKTIVIKSIIISTFQDWDIRNINPLMVAFKDVCYLSPNDTMELSQLKL